MSGQSSLYLVAKIQSTVSYTKQSNLNDRVYFEVEGYDNIDRLVGFDYEDAKLVLRDLATFHAVPIALKLKKRHIFYTKVKKNIGLAVFGPPKAKDGEEQPLIRPDGGPLKVWFDLLEKNDKCKLYIPRLKQIFEEKLAKMDVNAQRPKREPFATISHNDMWVNNTMQIIKKNKIVKNKFVDFQMYSYDSPALDLLFFIWTSIQLPIVKANFTDLLNYYYNNFLEVLEELGCNSKPFSYEHFEKELKESAIEVLFKCLFMFNIVFGKKGAFALDISVEPGKSPISMDTIEYTEERTAHMIQFFGRRGWL